MCIYIRQTERGSIKMAVDNAEHHHKNIIRRLVSLYNALQDFGPSGLVKKAHYLGNNTVSVTSFFMSLFCAFIIFMKKFLFEEKNIFFGLFLSCQIKTKIDK